MFCARNNSERCYFVEYIKYRKIYRFSSFTVNLLFSNCSTIPDEKSSRIILYIVYFPFSFFAYFIFSLYILYSLL